METMTIDCGMRSFQINDGGVLRFNPSDPNVYARFRDAVQRMETLTQEAEGTDGLVLADQRLKGLLAEVFGNHNDFDAILGGVNLLAPATNGKPVIFNLLDALTPVLEQGAKDFVQSVIDSE